MPDLFPTPAAFLLASLIIIGAQLIYATVGFGAGMFSMALLALVLPDLRGAVATLLLLTLITEIWVLAHSWRQARLSLLLGLLPTTILGLYLGTNLLADTDVSFLKQLLGLVVAAAGVWFLISERKLAPDPRSPIPDPQQPKANNQPPITNNQPTTTNNQQLTTNHQQPTTKPLSRRTLLALPIGLASGVLGGLFGAGGPPVIVLLRGYRLPKGAFRATILWFFLLMSALRGGAYLHAGLLTRHELHAALWLTPATIVGTLAGMAIHHRLPERQFATGVSILLTFLGTTLLLTGGR